MDTNEIFDKVKLMTDNDNLGNKVQIARMYGAFEREQAKVKNHEKYRDHCSMIVQDIIDITEDSAILIVKRKGDLSDTVYYQPMVISNGTNIIYETLDEAMIGLVCIKNDCLDAVPYINKLIK